MSQKYTSISVLPETRERLNTLGKKGDTYDDIIRELMSERGKGGRE